MTILRTVARSLFAQRFDDPGTLTPLGSLNDPSVPLAQAIAEMIGAGAADGRPELPPVTMNSAMAISALFRGIDILAGTIASLPCHIYDRDPRSGERHEVRSETEAYIWRRPNRHLTSVWFRYSMVAQMALAGRAFIYRTAVLDGFGRREMHLVHPGRVTVHYDKAAGRKWFVIDGNIDQPVAHTLDAPLDDGMIMIPFVSIDGWTGLGVVSAARLTLQLSRASQDMAANFYTQGSAPGGVLETDAELDEPKAERLRKRWEKLHGTYRKSNRVAVLDNGAHYKPITLSAADIQFLESRKFEVTEIARWLGIPPHLLADVQGSTSWGTGLEQQSRGFVTYSLMQRIRFIESAWTDELLISRGQREHYVSLNLAGLLRADQVARGQSYALGRQWGWLSANDIRRLEDLPPIEGGDAYMVPLNMADAAKLLEETEPSTAGISNA